MLWSILILLCLLPHVVFSRHTIITGHTPEYADISLIFYKYDEGIFNTKNKVFEINPDQEGYFHVEFKIQETTYLFAESGAFI
jgi:hypothetical protein